MQAAQPSLSEKEKLEEVFKKFRQDLQEHIENILSGAERKVLGNNSELRAVRHEMKKLMDEGQMERKNYQLMIAREGEKLFDTVELNNRYYQEQYNEFQAEKIAKAMKNVEIKADPSLPNQECAICYEEQNEGLMFGCRPLEAQKIEEEITRHFICANCCKDYAKSKVADGTLIAQELGFPCAEHGCEGVLMWGPMSKILDEAILKPLEARLAASALHGIGDIEFCKSCHYGMQIERQEQKFFACQNKDCRATFCRICHVDYNKHLNKSCDAADPTRKDTMKALEEFLSAAKIRVCPKCGTRFTKDNDTSCNKMTCRCGTTMCYICKASPVTYDHFEKPCPLFCNTAEADAINLDLALKEAKKEKRFERLIPLLLAKQEETASK